MTKKWYTVLAIAMAVIVSSALFGIPIVLSTWQINFYATSDDISRNKYNLTLSYLDGNKQSYVGLEKHTTLVLPELNNTAYESRWSINNLFFEGTVVLEDIFNADNTKTSSTSTDNKVTTHSLSLNEVFCSIKDGFVKIDVNSAVNDKTDSSISNYSRIIYTKLEDRFIAFNIGAEDDDLELLYYRYYYGNNNSLHKDYYPNDAMLLTDNSEPFNDEVESYKTITLEAHFG